MTGRPTAAIVAELRNHRGGNDELCWEAAHRLAPPCLTCDGTANLELRGGQLMSCPDCVDGKVPIEQLAATYNAVHGTTTFANTAHNNLLEGWNEAFDHLRAVKPT